MRKPAGLAVTLLLVAAAKAAAQEPAKDSPSIKNFLRVNDQICTGGQPTMAELEKLKQDGVRAIINLRRPSEYNAEEEAAKARELGLRYINIPVDSSAPKDSQAEEFLRATDDPLNRPAFIHCGSANRVGAFWMIRRVLRDGWPVEKAEDEAKKIGMHSPGLREFALDYIRRHPTSALSSPSGDEEWSAYSTGLGRRFLRLDQFLNPQPAPEQSPVARSAAATSQPAAPASQPSQPAPKPKSEQGFLRKLFS